MPKKGPPSAKSKEFVTKKRGVVKPPTARNPNVPARELSSQELFHERLEEKSLRAKWDRGELPATLKGLST